MKRILSLFACLAFFIGSVGAQSIQLLDPGTRDLLHEALSGEVAKEHVIAITRSHRIQGSRGYRDAANFVLETLHDAGYDSQTAFIESYPSDGMIEYQTWQSPSGWDIDRGELRMIEPYEERIVGYPEIAMSVITYSNAGEATGELVWVGSGTNDADYDGKDVAGKIVLATGYGGAVHRLAVLKYGALAVVCYLDDSRAMEYPDMLAYTGMWPLSHELENTTFGFNLTRRQGEKLRGMLEAGQRVVVRGQVEGIGLEPYYMDLPVAVIRGSEYPSEEVIFSAHLDHPKESANDNASGSAAILDIATTLKRLIDEGRLPAPKRTIRFIWVPEWYGTMAYVDAHPEMTGPELGGRVLANINMDMVGENLELLHSRMNITRTPDSMPSVLNEIVANMAEMVDGMNIRTPRGSLSTFNYSLTPYGGGSDHMMFIDRKIPGMMIGHGPDYTHHTSEDTPEKVDPVELERSELIGAGALWYLANVDAEKAGELVLLAAGSALSRLNAAARRADRMIANADDSALPLTWFEARNVITVQAQHAAAEISSVLNFADTPELRSMINRLTETVTSQLQAHSTLMAENVFKRAGPNAQARAPYASADNRIPARLTRGPLDFGLPESRLEPAAASWYRTEGSALNGSVRFEIANFVDGKRTVTEIRNLISAEFSPISQEVIARLLEDLVEIGVMQWAN